MGNEDERKKRLAEALRQNLRRRKAQARVEDKAAEEGDASRRSRERRITSTGNRES
ncbi:MAG: hypothetical protein M3N07_04930 [Pseudomonadota bacterium]|nr:hypothetical protein [Pseudomonadota bacterium]